MNMKRYILLGLFLLLGAAMQLSAQEKKAAPAAPNAKQPLAYEAFVKQGMRKVGEVLPIYTNDKQYYLEIGKEDLSRDLLVSGVIVKGPWCGQSSAVTDRIRFVLGKENTLDVMQEVWDARIDSTLSDPSLVEAFEASNMPSVKFSLPIFAYGKDKNSYIIDITKDVTSAGKLFAFPDLQWVNRPVANRLTVDMVCPLQEGVKLLVVHAQSDRMKGGFGMPGVEKHNTVRIEWAIQRLPQAVMATREADPRVGYGSLTYADYSEDPLQVKNKSIIRRWRLEVKPEDRAKYENGELVEPAEPIRVYLNASVDGGYREAAVKAVGEWNEAFAAAGFKNVLQLQEGEAPAQWGYHSIVVSFLECLPKLYTVSNPYTGEILAANVVVSLMDLQKSVPTVQTFLQAYEPKVFSELREEVRYQVFRRQFSFQLGNALGLLANDASRGVYDPEQLRDPEWVSANGISPSMMDCALVDFLVQPGDGVALEDLFGHVSHYDRWALEFGYRVYPEGEEKAAIRALLMQAKENPFLAYTPKAKNDLVPYNLSSDALAAVKLGMKNIDAAWADVEQLSKALDKEDSWMSYVQLANGLMQLRNFYLKGLQEEVGAIRKNPSIKGYSDEAFTFATRSEQKAVMDYILSETYSGVPAWMQRTRLRGLSGNSGEQPITIGMTWTSQFVTNPNFLNQLLLCEKEQHPGKAYTAAELYSAVNNVVFDNFSTNASFDRLSRRAHYIFMDAFVKSYVAMDVVKTMGTNVSNFMVMQMKSTLKSLDRLSQTHEAEAGRAYFRGLYVYAQHLFDAAEKQIQSRKQASAKALAAEESGNMYNVAGL